MLDADVDSNQWLVDLSVAIAGSALILFGLILLLFLRIPMLRMAAWVMKPLAPLGWGVRVLLMLTPLRKPLHRWLYVGHHLASS